jgi:hypothetical protein
VHDFLAGVPTSLPLDSAKLDALHAALAPRDISLAAEAFERVSFVSGEGVEADVVEDGLVVVSSRGDEDPRDLVRRLTKFYEGPLSAAFSYLFSLGAPVPKELASIKTVYPYFIVVSGASPADVAALFAKFNERIGRVAEEQGFSIHRGDLLYVIARGAASEETVARFVEEQIFVREFKRQLHRYLNLHRTIWERIAAVKERGSIAGSEIASFRDRVASYAKTVDLIDARINQMGAYLRTREAIAKQDPALARSAETLRFRYEALADTLAYVREVWAMTRNYTKAADTLFAELQAKSTEGSIQKLAVVTSMGVGANLLGLFAQKPPTLSWVGVAYFVALAAIGYASNWLMRRLAAKRTYGIRDVALAKDLD